MKVLKFLVVSVLAVFLFNGCGKGEQKKSSSTQKKSAVTELSILSGSENKGLEALIHEFARQHGAKIKMTYMGSIDTMLLLSEKTANIKFDAVWPANSLWISLGDKNKLVKHLESIMRSPVVLGIKKSKANSLGWLNKPIAVADILEATQNGSLRFAMTSATQSNSGASAYLGFLHALSGSPAILELENLDQPQVRQKVKALLSGVNRSSGSSGWLKETLIQHYERFQAMFNYEAMLIEANQALITKGQEPLYAVYPTDGIMMSDSPLGYIDQGNPAKEALFKKLQAFLLSDDVQKKILDQGRRAGMVGFNPGAVNQQVFNPEWGIDVTRIISPVPTPGEQVIRKALALYQSSLRKPSCTAYVVDVSGSMQGQGIQDLKAAMTTLLDPEQAARYMLQSSSKDIHIIIPFSGKPNRGIKGVGNSPETLGQMLAFVQSLQAGGGTNIYAAAAQGLQQINAVEKIEDYFPAVILMTDGHSQGNLTDLKTVMDKLTMGYDIPIHSITFGQASKEQLIEISKISIGRVFSGKNLIKAFRKAKGYN